MRAVFLRKALADLSTAGFAVVISFLLSAPSIERPSSTRAAAVDTEWAAPIQPWSSTAPRTLPMAGDIVLEGGEIRIDVKDMPLVQAVRRLATSPGAEGLDAISLDKGSSRITLHWHGDDAAEAWKQLRASRTSFGAECHGHACRVWLLALMPAHSATDRPSLFTETTRPTAPRSDPLGLLPAEH